MTNKEWLATLSEEQTYEAIHWIIFKLGRTYTNSRMGIIEWLGLTFDKKAFNDSQDGIWKECFYPKFSKGEQK